MPQKLFCNLYNNHVYCLIFSQGLSPPEVIEGYRIACNKALEILPGIEYTTKLCFFPSHMTRTREMYTCIPFLCNCLSYFTTAKISFTSIHHVLLMSFWILNCHIWYFVL